MARSVTNLMCMAAVMVSIGTTSVHAEELLIKTRSSMDVGVDIRDRWVMTSAAGERVALPGPSIRFASSAFDLRKADLAKARKVGLDRWIRVQVDPGEDAQLVMERIRQLPTVELVELDVIGSLAAPPNDPFFPTQWNMSNQGQIVDGTAGFSGADVRALGAWAISTGGEPVIVATLDSGAYAHDDFVDRILPGLNMVTGSTDTSDVCSGHGTRVAGIIAAGGDNGIGVAGINWTAQLLPIVVSGPCSVSQSDTANAITWAVDNGAQVINMSLQFSSGTDYFHDAIKYAAENDVVLVAAAGNTSTVISYPGRWPETIAVGAITNTDQRWSSSGVGPEIDLVAPGSQVTSTSMFNSYSSASGTSFAAPHVAGAAALLISIAPELDRDEIRDILLGTARDLGISGFDTATGWGCLDLESALLAVTPFEPNPDVNGDGAVDQVDLAAVLYSWGDCTECPADVDRNGLVDGVDLAHVLGNWSR